MNRLEVGGVATATLGTLWAVMAVAGTDRDTATQGVIIGCGVALTGLLITAITHWWNR